MDFRLFAQHRAHPVYLDANSKFDGLCVESLTPVDMVNLGSGRRGHCVWTGACWLVACLPQLQSRYLTNRRVIDVSWVGLRYGDWRTVVAGPQRN